MADKTIQISKKNGFNGDTILLTEGDNNTFTVDFVLERYGGDIDLSTLTWRVNFKTANGEKGLSTLTQTYSDDNSIILTWNIESTAVPYEGTSVYTIEGSNSESSPPVWRSGLQNIIVNKAVDLSEEISSIDPSLIDQMISEFQEDIVYVSVENGTLMFEYP